uniref:Uncharacterized protein n=1 Tax=Oryza brachyantha TaxID=4533 RepID=J3LUR3_ORYBR
MNYYYKLYGLGNQNYRILTRWAQKHALMGRNTRNLHPFLAQSDGQMGSAHSSLSPASRRRRRCHLYPPHPQQGGDRRPAAATKTISGGISSTEGRAWPSPTEELQARVLLLSSLLWFGRELGW